MSRILFDKLPSAVTVAGVELPVNTDFRCMARFENELLKDNGRDKKKRAEIFKTAMISFYKDNIPNDLDAAIKAMWWFYRCGEPITSSKNRAGATRRNVRLYDYEIDGQRIASAFRAQYGIDLTSCELHWWLFRGYFADLGENCEFVKIMSYRGINLNDISNKKERERYRKLKEFYALPTEKAIPMTKEERDEAYRKRLLGRI